MALPLAGRAIAFDAYNLEMPRGTGIATYARTLAASAKALGARTSLLYSHPLSRKPDEAEVSFFDSFKEEPRGRRWAAASRGLPYLATPFGLAASRVPMTDIVLKRQLSRHMVDCDETLACQDAFRRAQAMFFALGRKAEATLPSHVDIFHWTYPLPIKTRGAANIYTVHDLVPLRLPYTTLDIKRTHLALLRDLARTADHIVTVSENSKRDLIRFLNIDEARITNAYQTAHISSELRARAPDDIANEIANGFDLTFGEYFLFYGSLEPKKNLGRTVEAYLASGVKTPLAVVSAKSWLGENETRLLDQLVADEAHLPRASRRIRRYEYLPARLLTTLIQGARAVLFPSLYEGFGLPVLEAMTLGAPVVASREASVPEVAGDACLLVDPYDVDDIARAIRKVDADDALRAELRARGLKRAEIFSPQAYQAKLADLYAKFR
jgi:glycosyltransferase involved in cell wall biosynthesis